MSTLRVPLIFTEDLTGGTPYVRLNLIFDAALTGGQPNVRGPLVMIEAMTGGQPNIRVPLIVIQALTPIAEPLPVATAVFPKMRGLQWDRKKTPQFNTAVRSVTSGRETRTAYMQFPWWSFELVYSYLPDDHPSSINSSGYNDLQQLLGFFLQMQGNWQAFLYRDDSDYRVESGTIFTGDGVTVQFPLTRNLGGFNEPVGQIDQSVMGTFTAGEVDTSTSTIIIPHHGLKTGDGPFLATTTGALPTGMAGSTAYWSIVIDTNTIQIADSYANAIAGTAVSLTAAGSGTNTLTRSINIYLNGVLQSPSAYTLTLPNQIVFGVAPASGVVVTADFEFYFVCRFTDDKAEFNHFADKLWELQKLDFRSVIQ